MKIHKNFNRGEAVITTVIFLLFISLAIIFGISSLVLKETRIANDFFLSKKSYFLAEGANGDLIYRILELKNYSPEEVMFLDGYLATTTTTSIGDEIEIVSRGDFAGKVRKIKTVLISGIETSFHYGVQVGDGGVRMEQSSMITGNLYSNGPVESISANEIKGDVVSAGLTGLVKGVHATGTVYAHNITNSTIDKDAYYQVIDGVTKVGPSEQTCLNPYCHPVSPDQPLIEMPIPDEIIEIWKAGAAQGTLITSPCPYVINNNTTIGPAKLTCDLQIKGLDSPIITIGGPIWVEGNITIEQKSIIRVAASLGRKSVAIIADKESNRLTSSKIELQNSVVFEGSGLEGSYVLVLSQNNSAENGGNESAITIAQTVSGDLLMYAGHGKIHLNNLSDLCEVTAYKILMENQANVIYKTGLANLLFESGPTGGFLVSDWAEI
jgi:hypothetical protein